MKSPVKMFLELNRMFAMAKKEAKRTGGNVLEGKECDDSEGRLG